MSRWRLNGFGMRIVFVHQGYELYGSDRCFVDAVAAVRSGLPDADIEAVIPRDGPIAEPLREAGARIAVAPLWILRRRHIARLLTLGIPSLILGIIRAAGRFRTADLVYINTTVVFDHLLAARFFPGRAIVHIHELPSGATRHVLRALVAWSGAEPIFNSRATRDAYGYGPGHGHVVYAGIADPPEPGGVLYDGSRPLRMLMIGRINRNKGQDVLIRALAACPAEIRARLEVRIVGGAFEDPNLEQALREETRAAGLAGTVAFHPFADDPAPHYEWADIVVVPTTQTESLGRVAIEAMAHARPALVSQIGGLKEVVEDGVTGWTVPPGDADALCGTLQTIVESPERWRGFAEAARRRFETTFTAGIAADRILAIVRRRLVDVGQPGAAPLRA